MAAQARILVTGAGGFIGRRLVAELLVRGKSLRTLYRGSLPDKPADANPVKGDLLQPDTLPATLDGVDTAYYLVHSLDSGPEQFRDLDRRAADNFTRAAEAAGLKRVIYLSGLGKRQEQLSEHLDSREQVAGILESAAFQTTTLRAAIILGAGGASFELLRYLVTTQLLLPDAPQLQTRCQPIALDDVIGYLAGCLDNQRTAGARFDIGGPEIVNYRELLERFAKIAGTTNLFVPVSAIPAHPVSRWISLLSRQNRAVVEALLRGLANEVICEEQRIRELIRFELTPLDQAINNALRIGRGQAP